MKGDIAMLKTCSRIWKKRFEEGKLADDSDVKTPEALMESMFPERKSTWKFARLELDNILLSSVDFHCSNMVSITKVWKLISFSHNFYWEKLKFKLIWAI